VYRELLDMIPGLEENLQDPEFELSYVADEVRSSGRFHIHYLSPDTLAPCRFKKV
jgi:hypothetical protein